VVAADGQHRRDPAERPEDGGVAQVAGVKHEVDPGETLEDRRRQLGERLADVGVGDDADEDPAATYARPGPASQARTSAAFLSGGNTG
jgi:hypothetical protein